MTADIRTTVENAMREVFEDALPTDISSLDRDSMEAWDSLGHIRVISALEDALGLSFTLDEIEAMTSVPLIIQTINAKQ
jgi:acyl carrier protein